MTVVDANLLIYAIDRDSPNHARAKSWLEDLLSSRERVGLAWVVILAFLRLTTRPGILCHPLSVDAAIEYVDSWLAQPYVTAIGPGRHHWSAFRRVIQATGTGGNLTTDAHLAALALEHGAEIHSADHDFKRFPGVTHVNPLQAQ